MSDTQTLNIKLLTGEQVQTLGAALGGLGSIADRTRQSLGELDSKLLVLRLNLGKLKAALERAFAPIAARVVPMLTGAVRTLTAWVNDAARVISALFGSVEKKTVSTVTAAKALRRTLAGFDELQRLGNASGGGSVKTVTLTLDSQPLSQELQAVVDRINALLGPLLSINIAPAVTAFSRLGQAVSELGSLFRGSLQWAWENILVPLAKWTIEEAAPASVGLLTEALRLLSAALAPVLEGIALLMPYLEPVVAFLGETVVMTLNGLSRSFATVAESFRVNGGTIAGVFSGIGEVVGLLWETVQPILVLLRQLLLETMQSTAEGIAHGVGTVSTILHGLTEFLAGVFTGDWGRAWEGMKEIFKGTVNGILGFINGLISGVVGGINAVIRLLNKLNFDIPDWVPGLGGKHFGLNLKTVTAPQIPYLAKGAVLPANKPFLAMVGDQRHGTNVEAPLATIQEAVALVMHEQTDAIMAGFNASVGVQREILQAVLGISIGDEVIAAAYDRYRGKMAVVRGGGYA